MDGSGAGVDTCTAGCGGVGALGAAALTRIGRSSVTAIEILGALSRGASSSGPMVKLRIAFGERATDAVAKRLNALGSGLVDFSSALRASRMRSSTMR